MTAGWIGELQAPDAAPCAASNYSELYYTPIGLYVFSLN